MLFYIFSISWDSFDYRQDVSLGARVPVGHGHLVQPNKGYGPLEKKRCNEYLKLGRKSVQ